MIIYCYRSNEDESHVRYVGKTGNLARRKSVHRQCVKKGSVLYSHNWMRKVVREGFELMVDIIEEPSFAQVDERERYWIKRFKDEGHRLTNLSPGGLGGTIANNTLQESDVVELRIVQRSENPRTVSELRVVYGVYDNTIREALTGKTWYYITDPAPLSKEEVFQAFSSAVGRRAITPEDVYDLRYYWWPNTNYNVTPQLTSMLNRSPTSITNVIMNKSHVDPEYTPPKNTARRGHANIALIVEEYQSGLYTQDQLGKKHGLSQTRISKILLHGK